MKLSVYFSMMITMLIFINFMGYHVENQDELFKNSSITINETTGVGTMDISGSDWYKSLFDGTDGLIIVAGFGAAIVVGFLTKSFDWKIATLGFLISFLGIFIRNGVGIYNLFVADPVWVKAIIFTLFGTMSIMYFWSMVEWFAGTGGDS